MFHKIAASIYFHRKKAGLSRKALADLAGVGKTVIYDIEHGKERVQVDLLLKILHTLNIDLQLKSPFMEDFNAHYNHETSHC